MPETFLILRRSEIDMIKNVYWFSCRVDCVLKCDGTREETTFLLPAKRTSTFKSAGASVQSTTGRRVVLMSGSNAGYPMFRGSVKGTGYPLHSPVSPSLPLPCVIACHHISTGLYPLLFTGFKEILNFRTVFSKNIYI